MDIFAPKFNTLSLEETLKSPLEWRNIQDVIRQSFCSLTDIVKAQSTSLHELERQIASKPSRGELTSILAQKADSM